MPPPQAPYMGKLIFLIIALKDIAFAISELYKPHIWNLYGIFINHAFETFMV